MCGPLASSSFISPLLLPGQSEPTTIKAKSVMTHEPVFIFSSVGRCYCGYTAKASISMGGEIFVQGGSDFLIF
jgi:hypothetical protein